MGRFLRDIRRDSNRIPELALFATAELAMEASRRAWRQTWRDRGRLALHFMLVCGVASVFGVLITDGGLWTALAAPESLKSVFVGICNGVGVMLYFRLVVMHGYRRRLREEMVQLGIPICVHCGYDLRGLTESRCPECGRAFDSKRLTGPIVPTHPGETT